MKRWVLLCLTMMLAACNLTVVNDGGGVVTSTNGDIDCGATCVASYSTTTVVTLQAVADSGYRFVGWEDCPTVMDAQCEITMSGSSGHKTVTANFLPIVIMQMNVTGTISYADTGNPFGLIVGDTVTAVAIYDATTLTNIGFEEFSLGVNTGNTLDFTFGSVSLDEKHDQSFYGGNFPTIALQDGDFNGFDYGAIFGVNDAPANLGAGLISVDPSTPDFAAWDDAGNTVRGKWGTATFTVVGSLPATVTRTMMDVEGTIMTADIGNDFGLSAGDTVDARSIYDGSGLTGTGYESVACGTGTGNFMDFQIGSMRFDETHDQSYAGGTFPVLELSNGDLRGFDYGALIGTNDAPAHLGAGLIDIDPTVPDFNASDTSGRTVYGKWGAATFSQITYVP